MPKGAAGNKARAAEKKRKEIQRRPDVMMRAFTPVTDYIKKQNKVYIGCHPEGGRLNHFLGTADCVFYYSEFYEGIPDGTPKKQISRMILQNTREAAARNKTIERLAIAVTTPDQLSKTSTDSFTCFMDFTKNLASDKAELLSKELKVYLIFGL